MLAQPKPNLVFWVGYTIFQEEYIYGSELALMNVAHYLQKYYNVSVFGQNLTNTQIRGINFYHSSLLHSFNKIDVLIISRYINYFLEFPIKSKKVYLWLHDPCYHAAYQGENLPHMGKYVVENVLDKIDNIVVLGDYHRALITNRYEVPQNKFAIIPNAIDETCYQKYTKWSKIEEVKVPYRFIYTSDACRGLEELVKYIEIIHQEYPYTELYIYRDEKSFENYQQLLQDIRNTSYIHYMGKVDQTELAEAFAKSDVWLYPLKTTEMFCMSALEALRAGCYCVCNSRAALTQVVGEYGVLVEGEPTTFEIQERFLTEIRKAFNSSEVKRRIQKRAFNYAKTQTWGAISEQWLQLIR